MKLCLILVANLVCALPCFLCAKCNRRVCHLRLYDSNIITRSLNGIQLPLHCTHVILHCAQVSGKQEIDFSKLGGIKEIYKVIEIRRRNPHLKVILAIQNNKIADFVKMYTNDNYRKTFIQAVINYLRGQYIDGVKIDVQLEEGGDKEKFTLLIKELMTAFTTEASATMKQRLLLSVGIPSNKSFLDKYYDVLEISNYVDMLDLATYGFDLVRDKLLHKPQFHSPLFSKDKSSTKTIDFMAKYVAGKGVRKDKINIGLSISTAKYESNANNTMYSFQKFGAYGMACRPFMNDAKHYLIEPEEKGRRVEFFKVAGFYTLMTFYEDPETIRAKVNYIKANGFGGVLLYKIEDDDSDNFCKRGVNPLSRAVDEECSKP